jgi:hypothetical protein
VPQTPSRVPPPAGPWWRDARRRNRVAVIAFAGLALLGILYPAVTNYLLGGDRRVLVVTLEQGSDQADRQQVKQACGDLPGVSVVADRGDPDPRLQGRFPVRFSISGATPRQEADLESCVQQLEQVRGFRTQARG